MIGSLESRMPGHKSLLSQRSTMLHRLWGWCSFFSGRDHALLIAACRAQVKSPRWKEWCQHFMSSPLPYLIFSQFPVQNSVYALKHICISDTSQRPHSVIGEVGSHAFLWTCGSKGHNVKSGEKNGAPKNAWELNQWELQLYSLAITARYLTAWPQR